MQLMWDPYIGYYLSVDGQYAYDPYQQGYYGYQPNSGWNLLLQGLQALQYLFPQSQPAPQAPQTAPAPPVYQPPQPPSPIYQTPQLPNAPYRPPIILAPGQTSPTTGRIYTIPKDGKIPVATRYATPNNGNWVIIGDWYEEGRASLESSKAWRRVTYPINTIAYPDGKGFEYPYQGIWEGIEDWNKGKFLLRFENPKPDWNRPPNEQIRNVPVKYV